MRTASQLNAQTSTAPPASLPRANPRPVPGVGKPQNATAKMRKSSGPKQGRFKCISYTGFKVSEVYAVSKIRGIY